MNSARIILERLGELLGHAPSLVEDRTSDIQVQAGPWHFQVKYTRSGTLADVASAIRSLAAARTNAIPLLVVPYMSTAGQRRCSEAGLAWLDLSGNAHIVGPGLRVHVEGRPNLFVSRGRPLNIFAPQAARITRWCLMHPGETIMQRTLAATVRLDEGYTSRVVNRLLALELLARAGSGEIYTPDPDLLLDAWAERYQFEKHRILQGHVAARTGMESTRQLAERLTERGVSHAFTGLSAAWLRTQFASHRLTTLYVEDEAATASLDDLGFRLGDRGANTWLVFPNDRGVLDEAQEIDGVRCVHAVQTWLDLQAHPERATEAAAELRKREMSWHAR